jgi:WhiB family redox-sensing transcriptional regulator
MAMTLESHPRAWDANTLWREHSACADLDTNIFFPIGVTGPAIPQIEAAKAICAQCPVRAECLEFAVTTNQEFGVWGGLTEDERRVVRRRWRAAQRAARVAAS